MNKYENALQWLKNNRGHIDYYEFPEEYQELFEELIENKMPKDLKFDKETLSYTCQGCNWDLTEEEINFDYCPYCGQRIQPYYEFVTIEDDRLECGCCSCCGCTCYDSDIDSEDVEDEEYEDDYERQNEEAKRLMKKLRGNS